MRDTRFKHVNSSTEYQLKGSAVSWIDSAGQKFIHYYPFAMIENYFESGVWVELPQEQEKNESQSLTSTSQGTSISHRTAEGVADRRAIASDGGSSSYYDIGLPQWLVSRIIARQEDGRAYIKTEELIEFAFDDDFDAGNALKSLVRLWGAYNGAGKAGNSVSYEKNKIEYSVGKLEQRFTRKQEAA